jgi:orotate phosphoribosyltransferase
MKCVTRNDSQCRGRYIQFPALYPSMIRIKQMKEELIDILCRKSFKYSQEPSFKLVSGRVSRFYVNCKPTTLSARGMYLAGHLIFDAIKGSDVSAVGGLTFGADPLAVSTAFASEMNGQPINAFSIRKTRKDHGIVRWIEGDVQPGQRVAIIDDVATTGGSTVKAIERARSEGLVVVKSVILVDRQEGGLENIHEHVEDACAVITRGELMKRWKELRNDE